MKCKEDHEEDEEDCIICAHVDHGGTWKRWLLCWWLRHNWYYTYSWVGYCQRCSRWRNRKDY